jgi:hypothetical protein
MDSHGRFSNIVRPTSLRQIYDSILLEINDVVVSPTLGSIIPNWVLVIPKHPAINFAVWSSSNLRRPLDVLFEVTQRLKRSPEDVIWFEHGPAIHHSVVGCGIDHAHMHILLEPPFGFSQFTQVAVECESVSWLEGEGDPYEHLTGAQSYLVAGSGGKFALAQSVEAAGSQFFRRAIATLVGQPQCWDYRQHPFVRNAAETVASRILQQH